ncbi:MAG TPA: DUF6178 family protein [Kofleriaceae bacterium]|nr:DUF6178 family protein [Kofleriaceae bacterium]
MPDRNPPSGAVLASPAQPRHLLHRILDDARLVESVHALEPRALARLIRRVGLEDAGELISLATTEQLTEVFDDDLWRSPRPGVDESFDAVRFALWLEVMVEAGEAFAARRVSELDEDLISLALHRLVLVIDIDRLAVEMADRGEDDEAEQLEKALESCPYEELGQYRVIARRHDGWDAIVSVLLALDREQHDFLERLLERLAYVSAASIDDGGGLIEVLTAEETLAVDAAAAREDRRSGEGYVAPSAAASFLALAREGGPGAPASAPTSAVEDPITRAYFREYRPRPVAAPAAATAAAARLVDVLREAGVVDAARPLLGGGEARGDVRGDLGGHGDGDPDSLSGADAFHDMLADLAERDPEAHEQRMRELHYLANVLVAGCSLDGRRFRPVEAAEAVVATCNLGLEHLRGAGPGDRAPADRGAADRASAVALFRAGWHILHRDVVEPARRARVTSTEPGARAVLAALAGDCPRLTGPLAAAAQAAGRRASPRAFLATRADLEAARGFLLGRS